MMEDYNGSGTLFFPSSVLRLAFTPYQMSTRSKMVSAMSREKTWSCGQTLSGWWGGGLDCTASRKMQCKGWTWKWFSAVWCASSGAAASWAPGTVLYHTSPTKGAIFLLSLVQQYELRPCYHMQQIQYLAELISALLLNCLYLCSCCIHFPL